MYYYYKILLLKLLLKLQDLSNNKIRDIKTFCLNH